MPQLIKRGRLIADEFLVLRDAQALADIPDGTPVIVPLALWRAARAALVARGEVGVLLAPADDPAELAHDVKLIPVIAIDFPSFTDGRGYSSARLLRDRYHFGGELRAIGDIGRDQLHYLQQCGFDSFTVPDSRNAQDALAGFADFSDGYQATSVRTPWFGRRAAGTPPGDVWFPCA